MCDAPFVASGKKFFAKTPPRWSEFSAPSYSFTMHSFPAGFHHRRTDKPRRVKHSARALCIANPTLSMHGNSCGETYARRRTDRTTAEQLASSSGDGTLASDPLIGLCPSVDHVPLPLYLKQTGHFRRYSHTLRRISDVCTVQLVSVSVHLPAFCKQQDTSTSIYEAQSYHVDPWRNRTSLTSALHSALRGASAT